MHRLPHLSISYLSKTKVHVQFPFTRVKEFQKILPILLRILTSSEITVSGGTFDDLNVAIDWPIRVSVYTCAGVTGYQVIRDTQD